MILPSMILQNPECGKIMEGKIIKTKGEAFGLVEVIAKRQMHAEKQEFTTYWNTTLNNLTRFGLRL